MRLPLGAQCYVDYSFQIIFNFEYNMNDPLYFISFKEFYLQRFYLGFFEMFGKQRSSTTENNLFIQDQLAEYLKLFVVIPRNYREALICTAKGILLIQFQEEVEFATRKITHAVARN